MQFRVPQFINIEDKILGPLGWKQLAYVVAGLGITYLIFKALASKLIAAVLSIPAICLFGALAFVKINNKDFLAVMEDAIKFFFSGKIYTWQQDNKNKDIPLTVNDKGADMAIPKISKHNSLDNKAFDIDVNTHK